MGETIVTSRKTIRTGCRPSRVATGGPQALCRRLLALAAAALASTALFAPAAWAHHFTGEVQLWVSTMDFREAPGGVLVSVKLLEREYGESVSGFGVRVSATGGGDAVGPVELQESDFAVYTGVLPLSPGRWEVVATAHQGSSSLPAIESAQRETIEIDGGGRLLTTSGDSGLGAGAILAIVLPIGAAVLVLLAVVRRRRLAYDGEATAEDDPGAGAPQAPAPGGDAAAVEADR